MHPDSYKVILVQPFSTAQSPHASGNTPFRSPLHFSLLKSETRRTMHITPRNVMKTMQTIQRMRCASVFFLLSSQTYCIVLLIIYASVLPIEPLTIFKLELSLLNKGDESLICDLLFSDFCSSVVFSTVQISCLLLTEKCKQRPLEIIPMIDKMKPIKWKLQTEARIVSEKLRKRPVAENAV